MSNRGHNRSSSQEGGHGVALKYGLAVLSETFSHAASTTASPEEVWKALQSPDTWGAIGGVRRVEAPTYVDGELTGYDFVAEIAGAEHPGRARRSESTRGRSMVMAIESGQLTGDIAIDLLPIDNGTRVRVEIDMKPNGFLATMAFPLIVKAVAGGFERAVETFVDGLG